MGKKKNRFNFSSTNLVLYIWGKKTILIFICIVAAIVAAIYSYTLTPKYKSAVTMFPVSSASVSGSLLTESAFSTNDLLKFGGEPECEQLMQVLQSGEIRSSIMKRYNLARHYNIDPKSKTFHYQLNIAYDGNIKFRRTEYMSVVAEVMDADPDTAAMIANDIASYVDTVMNNIVRQRSIKALQLVEGEYQSLQNEFGRLQDSLREIRNNGVVNYEAQSQSLSNSYATAIKEGNNFAIQKLEKQLKILAKYGGSYVALRDRLNKYNDRLGVLASKYQQAKVDAEQTLPYKYVIEKAYPSEVKAYPVRSIMVLVTVVLAFLSTLIILIIRDTVKNNPKD